MLNTLFSVSRRPARIAATFDTAQTARHAADELVHEAGLRADRVYVAEPEDPLGDVSLVPGPRSVGRTLVRWDLKLGLVGLLIGVAIGLALAGADVAFATARPALASVALGALGAVIGLLGGGLASARHRASRLPRMASDAARRGQWMVIAHAADRAQARRVRGILSRHDGDVEQQR